MTSELHLYIDDSGSRNPDHVAREDRKDQMDCFALGGVLVQEEDIDELYAAYKAFCANWGIGYPLHSHAIRGGREDFGWLKKPENAADFLPALEAFLLGLPVIGIAAVVDRPGYVARYKDHHQERLWLMCKTAFSILVERAAKWARAHDRRLRVFFEESGKAEDRNLIAYARSLKSDGMPFNSGGSPAYGPITAAEFRQIVLGEPRRRSKKTPMVQIADLVLYPMAKGGYDASYRPYMALIKQGKLVDALLTDDQRAHQGIKYSCFERVQGKGPDVSGP